MLKKVPVRSMVDRKFTWNAESVFKSQKAWETELKQILQDIPKVKVYKGRLAEGPAVLLEALHTAHLLVSRAQKTSVYAGFSYAVDTTNQQAAGLRGREQGMVGQVLSAVSFLQPEILAIGKEKLDDWMSHDEKARLFRRPVLLDPHGDLLKALNVPHPPCWVVHTPTGRIRHLGEEPMTEGEVLRAAGV